MLAPALATTGTDRPGVIVPAPCLTGVPWGLVVPDLELVAPTVAHALTARTNRRRSGVVALAGPGLRAAAGEARAVTSAWPTATCITGSGATTAAMAHALTHAGLVHVAAHVQPRLDNPAYAAILCADGPLLLRELHGAAKVAPCVVLAACEAGDTADAGGQDVLGAAVHLLDLGARRVIAPVVPVDDRVTSRLMRELHARMAAGAPAPTALAALRASSHGDAVRLAHAAAFVCFAAG